MHSGYDFLLWLLCKYQCRYQCAMLCSKLDSFQYILSFQFIEVCQCQSHQVDVDVIIDIDIDIDADLCLGYPAACMPVAPDSYLRQCGPLSLRSRL